MPDRGDRATASRTASDRLSGAACAAACETNGLAKDNATTKRRMYLMVFDQSKSTGYACPDDDAAGAAGKVTVTRVPLPTVESTTIVAS